MAGYVGRDAVIVGAVRTPIGKGKAGGALHDVLPVDLLAHSLQELVARTGVDPAQIDDVIAGAVTQVGDQAVNIARNALLGAGFPESRARHDRRPAVRQQPAGHQLRRAGRDLRRIRHRDRRGRRVDGRGFRWARACCRAATRSARMAQRYPDGLVPQGISAELIAAKWGLLAQQLDEFSAGSHEKAAAATKEGRFDNELAPIAGLATDEIIRPGTTVETLASLQARVLQPGLRGALPADQVGDHRGQLVAAVGRQRRGAHHHRGDGASGSACVRWPASTRRPSSGRTRCTC